MENKERLITIAGGLKEILAQVVFVGGSVLELYLENETVCDIRQTDDIDVVATTITYKQYAELEERLRQLGFQHDMSEDAPICRKVYQGIKVDFMPTDENALGFSNQWYKAGVDKATNYSLTENVKIRIFPIAYFIASKISAFLSPSRKYQGDFMASHDFEDIMTILAYKEGIIEEIQQADIEVRIYLQQFLSTLKQRDDFHYILQCLLYNEELEQKTETLINKILSL
ncbi:MAG: hypothetical protein ACKVTZ_01730 [Bacteroidia bacterium]